MKIVCAWCGKDMGEKKPLKDKSVTHGMCEECLDKVEVKGKGKRISARDEPDENKAK